VAARNEARLLPRLLAALESLDYPAQLLHFVLISDGSNDSTPKLLENWTRRRSNAITLHLTAHAGKASALRRALELAPEVDLIAVLDADTVPEPGVLQHLAGAFRDPVTGAAGGYPEPHNANASLTARYAAIERWILHLVTLAGKDRLRLNPAAIGAISMIRRQALIEIGGFPVGATAEDIHISVLLNRAGWATRSVVAAVAREDVPESFAGFQAQRLRWSRGLMETRRAASGVEDVLVAAGYCDRLVLLAAIVLACAGWVPAWLLALYLAAPALTIGLAVSRARSRQKWRVVLSLPLMVVADVAVTAGAMLSHLSAGPIRWQTRQPAEPITKR
jgi:cellulose synthase/poly-beta-1,6-N-acetylglucosamine synthase-like glycosyltransferase